MTRGRDDELHVEEGDARFVARLEAEYAPEPQSAAQRQAFLRELEQRLERRRQRRRLLPALAGAAAAAAVAWLVLAPQPAPERMPGTTGVPQSASSPGDPWDMQLFYTDELLEDDSDDGATGPALPEEYAAIAVVFLDD
jgi:hypothetical protein